MAKISLKRWLKTVKTALEVDNHYSVLYISGGTILGKYQGQTELEFYVTRINALREKLQVLIPTTVQNRTLQG